MPVSTEKYITIYLSQYLIHTPHCAMINQRRLLLRGDVVREFINLIRVA